MLADPAVSRVKFDREVAAYRQIEPTLAARGWWLMKAEFPIVEVAFITVHLRPCMILLAVRIDFTDYDVLPLSVRFIDPFTGRMLLGGEIPMPLLAKRDPGMSPDQVEAAKNGLIPFTGQQLAQGLAGHPLFFCLPGVREYHENAAHSGDAWELHRSSGEGKMFNILDKVWRYGTDPIVQLGIGFQFAGREMPA